MSGATPASAALSCSTTSRTTALTKIIAGETLPDTRFDITTTPFKLRDVFSRH